jgi:DNA-binding winged helix-turn-helix (wHTH) protein
MRPAGTRVIYRFGESGEFELDARGFELRRGGALLETEPKVLELLLHLAAHADRLVPREELLAAVWRDVHVEEDSLYRAVAVARRLLGQRDGADAPIRTVRGRGYRLVGDVQVHEGAPEPAAAADLPGRAGALADLAAALARARTGKRQLVIVSGEAGLGKTRLVDAFSARLAAEGVLATTGQCLVPHEGGEPYSPLLEALARLRRRGGERVRAALESRAPAWLEHLPGAVADRSLFAGRSRGATRERLVEELADAIDEIASAAPLVVVLEDLHACDRATQGLLAALAQRREKAALLVVGTVRTGDPASAAGPLWRLLGELKGRGQCLELELPPLTEADVAAVVRERTGGIDPDADRVRWLAQRSTGNPLYLHALLDSRDAPERSGDVPELLADRIARLVDSLDRPAQRLLEAASLAGLEFSAAEVAAALDAELLEVEEGCDELARRALFLARAGAHEWPDGTVAASFRFRHGLHREVLAARAPPARARSLHLRLADRLARAFAARPGEHAAVLADHFERGGAAEAAVRHYRAAVLGAARRHAGHEAWHLASRALALVARLPAADAAEAELALRFAVLPVLPEALGFDHPEVERNLERAQALCEAAGDDERRSVVLWSRSYARFQVGDAEESVKWAEELLRAARSRGRPLFEVLAHGALTNAELKACRLEKALAHADRVRACDDAALHAELVDLVGRHVGVDAATASAFALFYLGRIAEAQRRGAEAVARARAAGHGWSLVVALCYAAVLRLSLEDMGGARVLAEEAMACADRERLLGLRSFADLVRAATVPKEDGRMSQMVAALAGPVRDGIPTASGEPGVRMMFARAIAEEGLRELALAQVVEAFASAERSGERHYVPSLHLLRASLAREDADVEHGLAAALASAEKLGLPLAQLEAATEMARFRARCGRRAEARALLAPHVAERSGEPDVPIVARARTLLAELGPEA